MGNTFRQEDDGKYPLPKDVPLLDVRYLIINTYIKVKRPLLPGGVSPGRGGSAPAGKFGLGRGSFGETLGRKMTGPINLSLKTQVPSRGLINPVLEFMVFYNERRTSSWASNLSAISAKRLFILTKVMPLSSSFISTFSSSPGLSTITLNKSSILFFISIL